MNNDKKRLTLTISAIGATLVLLGAYSYPLWAGVSISSSAMSENTAVQAPETFAVVPESNIIESTQFTLGVQSASSSISTRSASANEIANFIVPTTNQAFAISPGSNSVTLNEWTSPTAAAGIVSTSYDPNANVLWFPEPSVGKIAKLDPSTNTITEYTMPTGTPVSFPVTVDPATGNVYFIESQAINFNRVARLNPTTGGITEWFLQCCGNGFTFTRLAFDSSSGNVWIESNNREGAVSSLNPSTNVQTKWVVRPDPGNGNNFFCAQPVFDSSGNVWFSQTDTNTINRLNPATNQLTKWPIPQPGSIPCFVGLNSASPNLVYFAEAAGNRIGKLDASSNQITQWVVPTASSGPDTLIVDGQGVVYFRELNSNKVGRLVPTTNTITEWTIAGARAGWFSIDGSDNLYFSEESNGIKVGRLGS